MTNEHKPVNVSEMLNYILRNVTGADIVLKTRFGDPTELVTCEISTPWGGAFARNSGAGVYEALKLCFEVVWIEGHK